MKNKKKHLILEETVLLLISTCITFFIIYFWFKRLIPRLPREIFYPPTFLQGLLYLTIFLFNIILLGFMLKHYVKGTQKITSLHLFLEDFNNLMEKNYFNVLILISRITILGHPIAYMTHYFLRIGSIYYVRVSFIAIGIFMGAFLIDVFLGIFYYSYISVYLLLIPLTIRFILYLSLVFNEELRQDINRSLRIINTGKLYENPSLPLNIEDYTLTEHNIQFKSVEEALNVELLINLETARLLQIKGKLVKPFWFLLAKRTFFAIIWLYIYYYYPFPVIHHGCTILYKILIKYIL